MNHNNKIIQTSLSTAFILLVGCVPDPENAFQDSDVANPSEPDLTIDILAEPESHTTLRYAEFDFTAPDASEYLCTLDNVKTQCETPFFIAEVSEGSHEFAVQAISEDGTYGDTITVDWTVDSLLLSDHDDLVQTNVSPSPVDEASWRGIFRINCDFAHSSYNDPIVFPGDENAAHLHRFYGNTDVDHDTTLATLYQQGESSCQGNLLNLSSYWVPALLAPDYDEISGQRKLDEQGDPAWKAVPAVVGNDDEAHEVFYYSAGVDDLNSIQPIPAGLRMIAGDNSTQPGEEQSSSVVRWHCQSWESDDASNPQFSASIPVCEEPDRVRLDVFFPSCWNGTDLDSDDHKSHMAYPENTGGPEGVHCPDSHPVPVVRVSYHYAYGVKPDVSDPESASSRGWRVASDMYTVTDEASGGLSIHADWINGWHPTVMQTILENCIQGGLDCHDGNLANGTRLSGTQPGSQVEPEVYNAGMSIN